jgi:hypothetical protein
VTAVNLLALGLISQRVQWPSGWNPLIKKVICAEPGAVSGMITVGLFYLDKLRKSRNPMVQNLLTQTTI